MISKKKFSVWKPPISVIIEVTPKRKKRGLQAVSPQLSAADIEVAASRFTKR